MNSRERMGIVNDLTHIAKQAIAAWPDLYKDMLRGRQIVLAPGKSSDWYLADADAQKYGNVVNRILELNSGWRRKFRDADIIGRFNRLVGTARDERAKAQRVGELFDVVAKEYDSYSTEQIVYLPLGGFQIDDHYTLRLGNITLMRMSDARFDELLKQFQAATAASIGTAEEKQETVRIQQATLAPLRGLACAEYRIIADGDRARELAEVETRRVLELLRVAIPVLYAPGYKVSIGFKWEVRTSHDTTPVIAVDAREFLLHTKVHGPLRPFELDPHTERALEEMGLLDVAHVLERPEEDWTHFERQLIRAIHWFSDAQLQAEAENALTSLTTSLEALFTPRKKDQGSEEPGIIESVVAGVGATVATTPQERDSVREQTRRLYNLRSDTTHGRHVNITEVDRARFVSIPFRVLTRIIPRMRDFESKDALLAWVKAQATAAAGANAGDEDKDLATER